MKTTGMFLCLVLWLGLGVAACHRPTATTAPTATAPNPADFVPAQPDETHLANIRQLTFGGENAEAYWSHDGQQLIMQSTRPGVTCDQIYRASPTDPAMQTMVSSGKGRTTCAYFLAGNEDILYASTEAQGEACPPPPDQSLGYVWALYDYDLYRAKADGSGITRLTNTPAYDAEATVCGVDGRVLFTSDRDGDLELYTMKADGTDVKRITHTPGYDGGAFFSPDCKQIVWRASRPTGEALVDYQRLLAQRLVRPSKLELYVADADGSNARQVTYLGAASFAPYFHPSGQRILFSTNYPNPRGREFDIWAIDVAGTNLERITFSEGFDGFPMFSPDGKKLVFASNRRDLGEGGTYRLTGGAVGENDTNIFVADWIEHAPQAGLAEAGAPERILSDIAYLADDAREGRGLGTKGLADALTWAEARFAALGLVPMGNAFAQPFEVTTATKRSEKTALILDAGVTPTGPVAAAVVPVAPGVMARVIEASQFEPYALSAAGTATSEWIDVGWGLVAADYKKAKGKFAVAHRFEPDKSAVRGDTSLKASLARAAGAVGLILVDDGTPSAAEQPLPQLMPARSADAGLPVVFVTRQARTQLATARTVTFTAGLVQERTQTANVVGVMRGSDPTRAPIVIGAHIDHLGYGGHSSLDGAGIHNGADDNASGVAVLLEVARMVVAKRTALAADVVFMAFSAEEIGIVGSSKIAAAMKPKPAAMINMDMVGRMRDNQVTGSGADSASEWRSLIGPLCDGARIRCELSGSGYGPSDHMSFYQNGVPVLHFFTGAHLDYHRQSDDANLINAAGAARIADVVAQAALTLAGTTKVALTYQKAPAPAPLGEARRRGASLGTVPSYNDDSNAMPGVLLADVVPGGAAQKAGLRGGDRIVAIGPREIRNIEEFMDVLVAASPGDTARITIVRDGQRRVVEAVYGAPRR